MAATKLKFALFGNEYEMKKSASIRQVLSCLEKKGAEIYIDKSFCNLLSLELGCEVHADGVFEGHNFDVDYAISLGGDGTFLRAADRVGAKGIPIIGVNMGRLGFLADVLPTEIEECIDTIYKKSYKIENHTVIQAEAENYTIESNPNALNDIAILKRDDAAMISIRVVVNGEFLVTYQADGLVISTPTGSTAYNLSNGGPIIVPQSGSICLTPVAPHSLNIRPIVINDDSVIELSVESRSHNFLVAIDGRSEKLTEGTKLSIRKAPYAVKIIKLCSKRYFSTLREKLMWGADQRQKE
jgi:NAD+ kinase